MKSYFGVGQESILTHDIHHANLIEFDSLGLAETLVHSG